MESSIGNIMIVVAVILLLFIVSFIIVSARTEVQNRGLEFSLSKFLKGKRKEEKDNKKEESPKVSSSPKKGDGFLDKLMGLITKIVILAVIVIIGLSIVDAIKGTSSNQGTPAVQKDEWVGSEEFRRRELRTPDGYETDYELKATTDKWSKPVILSYNEHADMGWECSGKNEDGKMRVLVVSSRGEKEFKLTCREMPDLGEDFSAPLTLQFKAVESSTNVEVKVTKK